MNHTPEELLEKLINNRISREEFEVLIAGMDDSEAREQCEIYLQQLFEQEIDRHFSEEKTTGNLTVTKGKRKKRNPLTGNKSLYAVAASVLLLAGIISTAMYVLTQYKFGNQEAMFSESGPNIMTKTTPNGRMFRMNLDDGSFVQLNAASTVSYPNYFDGENREISMAGEAYFNIARDEQRPFTIHTNNADVEVLGTSFSIQSFPDEKDFYVMVESGTVRVNILSKAQESVILEKGQKLIVNFEESLTEIVEADAEAELSWRSGVLRFSSTPMDKVARMLERWYGIEVILENEASLSRLTLTGIHKNENLKSVVQAITYATGTRYEIKDNSLIIKN